MKNLVIFGTATLARLAHYYASRELGLETRAFVVDDQFHDAESFLSLPIHRWSEFPARFRTDEVALHVAVGYRRMRVRAAIFERIRKAGYECTNLVSTASFAARGATIGTNCFIMPGVVIEPGVAIGDNNVIWSHATICHDARIGDHNFIAANATIGGEACIGNGNFIGFSAVVAQGRKIGDETLIGAQSLLLSDPDSLSRYHGVPARKVGDLDRNLGIVID